MDTVTTLFETEKDLKLKEYKAPALVLLKNDGASVSYSWKDYIHRYSLYVAEALLEMGLIKPKLKPGENNFIAIIPLNLPESFFGLLGIIMAGGVPVPIHPLLLQEPEKVKDILAHCNPKHVLANVHLADQLKEKGVDCLTIEKLIATGRTILNSPEKGNRFYYTSKKPKDLLIMPYTSGTSGKPKGVMLSHENILDRTKAVIKELGITPQDRILSYMTLGHISELIATFFGQMVSGYTVYFTDYSTDREKLKENFTSVLKKVRPTVFLGVPKVWVNIETGIKQKIKSAGKMARLLPMFFLKDKIRQELGLDHTRISISAGSEINQHEINFFRKLGLNIIDIYGQTETAGPLLINGSVLGDTNQVFLEPFSREVVITGKAVMLGYHNNPEANDKVFETDKILKEVLYHTGDIGKFNILNKTITIAGRMGDGYKSAQGEYITEESIQKLEQEVKDRIRDIDPQAEVIVCGKGKSYQVALIFLNNKPSDKKEIAKLYETLKARTEAIGKGLTRIGGIAILSSQTDLILTPTLKPRKKEIIEKFQKLIDEL